MSRKKEEHLKSSNHDSTRIFRIFFCLVLRLEMGLRQACWALKDQIGNLGVEGNEGYPMPLNGREYYILCIKY